MNGYESVSLCVPCPCRFPAFAATDDRACAASALHLLSTRWPSPPETSPGAEPQCMIVNALCNAFHQLEFQSATRVTPGVKHQGRTKDRTKTIDIMGAIEYKQGVDRMLLNGNSLQLRGASLSHITRTINRLSWWGSI